MPAEIHPTATVHEGTILGDGVRVLENAVVGKQPTLGARSTAKREPLPPARIGDGTVKTGPTHEALNLAAVQKLPVIFIIQNNQVASSTLLPSNAQPWPAQTSSVPDT